MYLNNRTPPNYAYPPCNLSPAGLRTGDFQPLLRPWDHEIRDQRALKHPLLTGQGLGRNYFFQKFVDFFKFSGQNYPWMTSDGPGMDPNDLQWTWVGPRLTWVGPGLILVGPGLTRVRPRLTWVRPGLTQVEPGKNPGKTREKPGLDPGWTWDWPA